MSAMGTVLFIFFLVLVAVIALLVAAVASAARTINDLRHSAMGLPKDDYSEEKESMVWLSRHESRIDDILGGDKTFKLLFPSVNDVVKTVGPVFLLARDMLNQGFKFDKVTASIDWHFSHRLSQAHAIATTVLVSFMMSGMVRLEKDKELRIWVRSNDKFWPNKMTKRLLEIVMHSLDEDGGPGERNATSDEEREAWKTYRAMSKLREGVMNCWSM